MGMAAGLGARRVGWGGMALAGGRRCQVALAGAAVWNVAAGRGSGQASRKSAAPSGPPVSVEARPRVPRWRGALRVGSPNSDGGPLGRSGPGPRAPARPEGRFAGGSPRVGAGVVRRLGPTPTGPRSRSPPWSSSRPLPQVYVLRDGSRADGTARAARDRRLQAMAHRSLAIPPDGRPLPDPRERYAARPGPGRDPRSSAPPGLARTRASPDGRWDGASRNRRSAGSTPRYWTWVRLGSGAPARVGPPTVGRPNGAGPRPGRDPPIWARRPGCLGAGPGSRDLDGRPPPGRRMGLPRRWARRFVLLAGRRRGQGRGRASRAGWRWRDRSGARATSRSMRQLREGRPRREWRARPGSDPARHPTPPGHPLPLAPGDPPPAEPTPAPPPPRHARRSRTCPASDPSSPAATAQRSRTGAGGWSSGGGAGRRRDRRWGRGPGPGGRRSGTGSGRWPGSGVGSGGR